MFVNLFYVNQANNKVPRKNIKQQQQTVDNSKRSMLNSNQYNSNSKTDSGMLINYTYYIFIIYYI